jgi:hypothetical protein
MRGFALFVTLALSALAAAQAPAGGAPAAGQDQAPCPPQFQLQCCTKVVSAKEATLIGLPATKLPGLSGGGCTFQQLLHKNLEANFYAGANLAPTAQCQTYPVCCKSAAANSAGCIPA